MTSGVTTSMRMVMCIRNRSSRSGRPIAGSSCWRAATPTDVMGEHQSSGRRLEAESSGRTGIRAEITAGIPAPVIDVMCYIDHRQHSYRANFEECP
jgi:hypothetical protein